MKTKDRAFEVHSKAAVIDRRYRVSIFLLQSPLQANKTAERELPARSSTSPAGWKPALPENADSSKLNERSLNVYENKGSRF